MLVIIELYNDIYIYLFICLLHVYMCGSMIMISRRDVTGMMVAMADESR